MVIVSKAILREFTEMHPQAKSAVFNWYELVKNASWKDFSEMKGSFNSVDSVGNDRYVFNLKGNHYRLITLIIFRVRTVFILFIGSHEGYDKIKAKNVTYKKP